MLLGQLWEELINIFDFFKKKKMLSKLKMKKCPRWGIKVFCKLHIKEKWQVSVKIHQNKFSKFVVECKNHVIHVEIKLFTDFKLIKCTEVITAVILMLWFPHCLILLIKKSKPVHSRRSRKQNLWICFYQTTHKTKKYHIAESDLYINKIFNFRPKYVFFFFTSFFNLCG